MKWILMLLVLPWVAGCGEDKSSGKAQESLDPQVFSQTLSDFDNTVLIDVRTPGEWNTGIIEGAMLIDIYDKAFPDKLKQVGKESVLMFYCRSGARSKGALEIAKELGFTNTYHLDGGISRWVSQGLPTVTP